MYALMCYQTTLKLDALLRTLKRKGAHHYEHVHVL